MRFRFAFRRYRLRFRVPVRTAHGPWVEREGLIVRLDDASEGGSGRTGFGEAAPIPWFGTETIEEDEAAARAIGEWVEEAALDSVPAHCACLRHALAEARMEIVAREGEGGRPGEPALLSVAALLPAGRGALAQIAPKAEMGFRVFKWKVGVADVADELSLLDDVCAALPPGAKLRLDANGAWDRRRAERWLERCAERPVEFVEQPCFAPAAESATQRRKVDDMLLGLAAEYPTPIALDESLVGDGDVERWIGAGWPGIFVVKPSLLADVRGALAALAKAKVGVVFSSALETAIGARQALRAAFAWQAEIAGAAGKDAAKPADRAPRALGFGVWPLFADGQFDGGAAVPFVRREDLERSNAEALWNALS